MTARTDWISVRDGGATFALSGDWSIANGHALERAVADTLASGNRPTTIDLAAVGRLDTVGAWLVIRLRRELGDTPALTGVRREHGSLIERLADVAGEMPTEPDRRNTLSALAEITGRAT